MKTTLAIALTALALAACGDPPPAPGAAASGKPAASGATAAASGKPAASAATTAATAASDDVPTPADFEEQAEKEITEENLDDQLAAMEKEITADAP